MTRASRKLDHLNHALELGQFNQHGFDDVHIVANSIPETNLEEIELATSIGGLNLSSPILINAMTGGGSDETFWVNQQLAIVAKEKGLAMAVGSQMAALKEPEQKYTYTIVRQENPKGIIFANLGAEATVDQAKQAIEMLEADALQIHVNVVQELVMPEGDRSFSGLLHNIEQIVEQVSCPVIVKEVGFGLSLESVEQLRSVGVRVVDIGGFGGTNFSLIENKRRENPYTFFDNWGIKTVPSLIEATQFGNMDVIASGGINSSLHILKSMILGAKAVGLAGFFLKLIKQYSMDDVLKTVDLIHEQLQMMMCALGVQSVPEMIQVPVVISGESYHWLAQRGIDTSSFARRGRN